MAKATLKPVPVKGNYIHESLSKALADIVMLKAELADARAEIKDLNRPRGMSWEEATCGDPESE